MYLGIKQAQLNYEKRTSWYLYHLNLEKKIRLTVNLEPFEFGKFSASVASWDKILFKLYISDSVCDWSTT